MLWRTDALCNTQGMMMVAHMLTDELLCGIECWLQRLWPSHMMKSSVEAVNGMHICCAHVRPCALFTCSPCAVCMRCENEDMCAGMPTIELLC